MDFIAIQIYTFQKCQQIPLSILQEQEVKLFIGTFSPAERPQSRRMMTTTFSVSGVGYENRLLNPEDFKDDKKDAGEMGAGHTVTVL